ncbi:MAG TPA: hypothetical protein VHC73_03315 [Vitreimonas sp.]|jgi:hypothetical protein|nr:hypothetical protein [Vitreimonas sp.]
MFTRHLALAALLSVALMSAAEACPPPPPTPPPPPGESIEAYNARLAEEAQARVIGYQRGWWERAQSVLLARIERRDSISLKDDRGVTYARSPRVLLRPVRWLKGEGPPRRFYLNYSGLTDCGPYGGGEAVDGEVGDFFVVFVSEGPASQASVVTSLALDSIVDQDLKDRIGDPDTH